MRARPRSPPTAGTCSAATWRRSSPAASSPSRRSSTCATSRPSRPASPRSAPFDALVNAAGLARVAPLTEITPKGWDLLIDVNLTGAFNVLRAAAPHLTRRRRDRDHLLDRLGAAGLRPRALLRLEGRRRGALALRRPRARPPRHPLQRRRAGRRADAADGAVPRPPGGLARLHVAHPAGQARGPRRRRRRRRRSSSRRPLAGSPARGSPSTAASASANTPRC